MKILGRHWTIRIIQTHFRLAFSTGSWKPQCKQNPKTQKNVHSLQKSWNPSRNTWGSLFLIIIIIITIIINNIIIIIIIIHFLFFCQSDFIKLNWIELNWSFATAILFS